MDGNPYASPRFDSDGLPPAPKSGGWRVVGSSVVVGKVAQFPMVDPYTSKSEDPMGLQCVEIRHHPVWLWAIPFLAAVLATIGGDDQVPAHALIGLVMGLVVKGITHLFFPVCTLMLFFEKRTLGNRKKVSGGLGVLFLVAAFGGFVPQLHALKIPVAAFAIWLVGLLGSLVVSRRLRCRRRSGDGFEITGFHPRALARLSDIENDIFTRHR